MSNFVGSILDSNLGRTFMEQVLPKATKLERYNPSRLSFFDGRILIGTSVNGALLDQIMSILVGSNAQVFYPAAATFASDVIKAGDKAKVKTLGIEVTPEMYEKFDALVFDATGFANPDDLSQLYYFFHPVMRKIKNSGRVIVLGRPPMQSKTSQQAAAQRALEGFVRSVAKEVGKKGITAQTILVEEGAEAYLDAPFRFVLSAKSAYVDAQVFTVRKPKAKAIAYPDWHKPLEGKVALVTGAARGIGEAIARTLARDGAKVLGLDIAPAQADLDKVMASIGGESLVADISAADAPQLISAKLKEMGGGDIIVHNAGVTRDKTLANMPEHWWKMAIDINLTAEETINAALLKDGTINKNGSIVCVSSMVGISGQVGQTNYAASKAGVIGYVQFMAEELADKQITINAVAPGFIETVMTDAIPVVTREIGRRLNSLGQGGKPIDVAELIAFFGNPAANGVTGNVVRVCGQSLVGA